MKYVALLRGVNVGGINMKMADVRKTFQALGFDDVKTVLASGNVLFASERADRVEVKADIERALAHDFGYEAWIVLLDVDEMSAVAAAYPFDPERAGWHPYVVFGSDPAILDELAAVGPLDPALERTQLGDGVLYWEVERGHTLQSVFGKTTGKKRYKSSTTTRNLRTVRRILG